MRDNLDNETTPSAFAAKLPMERRPAGPAPFFSAVTAALFAGVPVHVGKAALVVILLLLFHSPSPTSQSWHLERISSNTMQVLLGTLVLSSLTFISAFDSISVVAFYALSTIASKAIVVFECVGIQAVASNGLDTTTVGELMDGYSVL